MTIFNAVHRMLWNAVYVKAKVLITIIIVLTFTHADLTWDNRLQMDENYVLQWSVREPDIVFEMQVRAHGYIGFGLSRDGTIYGSDIFISWIDDGHMFFYDCHIKTHTQTHEPVVDTSQDYELLTGSENSTHTILRFRRKLNTCDDKSDVPITNDTMNVIYIYHDEKPKRGQFRSENLPNLLLSQQQIRPLLLLQRSPTAKFSFHNEFHQLEIRMPNILIESAALLKWCHSFKINHSSQHIVRYEPIFSSNESSNFITFMRIYECRSEAEINEHCSERLKMERKCLMTVAIWTKGSLGFTYPNDVAYPLTAEQLLLEIHYQDSPASFFDNSGFQIFTTSEQRLYNAGTIAINIRPNFLHIVAPGFKRVISIGHCTSNCTQKLFPDDGLNIFGITMQTHNAGTMIKLIIVRNGEELEPLASDSNLNANYVETRLLSAENYRKLMPGDHLMVECTYNTFKRERFTLGGESSNEEVCMAMVMYYPRQEQLVACNSQSKISDVLRALGIEELGKTSNQTVISKPERYAGRTLEKHLELYDWRNEFFTFERTIKTSPFDGYCNSAVAASRITGSPPIITKPYRPPDFTCPTYRLQHKFDEESHNENSIDEIKEVRSPSTLQQHTSYNECTKATISIFIIMTFIHVILIV
ncbi:hypothetical protein PVAND_015506 [Polypedilum vanderplanki]|uniref:DOMON domain-containing protein n=1 Tax=Polypedilum vanderplanki TaxID=319348 RepID=A0A9J6BD13_POLVA|nr:hypothetical protein PVAND_015506 [Polypedilum vanderplanki]